MASEPSSFGFSLFCDDVRQEVGGKLSYMGVYLADMIFARNTKFPVTLPRFAIVVKYFELLGMFSEDLTLEIFLPGDAESPTVRQGIPRSGGTPPQYPLPPDSLLPPDSDKLFMVTFPVMLSPFTVKESGYIRVRIVRGKERLRVGSLLIRAAEENEKLT